MPRPRFHRLPPERRSRILDVAARHFAAAGFANASLNRILEDAGVSKGAAYYYFDDKGDLFATVVEDAWDEVSALLWPEGFDPSSLRGDDFWATLEGLYRRQVALFAVRPDVWRMVKSTPEVLHDPSGARLAPRFEAFMQMLGQLVHRAQQAGHIRDDLPFDLLMAMLQGLDDGIDRWLIDHPEALRADPELAARTFAALRDLVQPPAGVR